MLIPGFVSRYFSSPHVPPEETGFYAHGPETPDRMVFRRGAKKTVFYIEDDLTDIVLLNQAIDEAGDGVRLVAFRNPGEALLVSVHASVAPDVVVLDINMPVINGLDLMDRLRSIPLFKKTPIVFLTTSSNDYFRLEAQQRGADMYLVKPLTYAGYPEAARRILDVAGSRSGD